MTKQRDINNFVRLQLDNGCYLWVDPSDVIAVFDIPRNERLEIEEAGDIHLVSGAIFKSVHSFKTIKRIFNGWDGTDDDTSDLLLVAEHDKMERELRDVLVCSAAKEVVDTDGE